MRKTKEEQIVLKRFLNLEKQLVENQRQIMNIVENMRLTSINAKITNFKNEKILNFLIDLLIESGPDP